MIALDNNIRLSLRKEVMPMIVMRTYIINNHLVMGLIKSRYVLNYDWGGSPRFYLILQKSIMGKNFCNIDSISLCCIIIEETEKPCTPYCSLSTGFVFSIHVTFMYLLEVLRCNTSSVTCLSIKVKAFGNSYMRPMMPMGPCSYTSCDKTSCKPVSVVGCVTTATRDLIFIKFRGTRTEIRKCKITLHFFLSGPRGFLYPCLWYADKEKQFRVFGFCLTTKLNYVQFSMFLRSCQEAIGSNFKISIANSCNMFYNLNMRLARESLIFQGFQDFRGGCLPPQSTPFFNIKLL